MDIKRFRDSVKADIKAEMKPRKLLRTAFVPQTKGLLTPIKEVFQVFITLIAQIFVQAKLITRDHPSAKGEIHGFGAIWLMIIDASGNVKFKRENIYQIVVFYGIVGMLVFGVLDLAVFLMHLSMGHAHAAANNTASLFNETNTSDNAPTWINTMFPYANNQTGATAGLPLALQSMLTTYNTALLALGTAFALYQVVHLFMESAHHGKFGGNRYSQLHAPLRLVIGIGLLVPTSYGFNSAQLIAIQTAKWGSGLASHVWQSFENGLTAYTGNTPSVQAADVNTIIQKLLVDETCEVAAESANGNSQQSGQHAAWNPTETDNAYVITFDDKPGDAYCGSITIPKQKSNQYTLAANNYFEQAFIGSGGGGASDTTGILATIWAAANDIYQNSSGGTDPNGATDPTQNPFLPSCAQNCISSWPTWLGLPAANSQNSGTISGILAQMQTAATNTANAYQQATNNNQNNNNQNSDWTQAGYLFLKMTHDAADQGTAQNPTIDVVFPDASVMNVASGTNTAGQNDCNGIFSFLNYACDSQGKTVVTATAQAIGNIRSAVPVSGLSVVSFAPQSNGSGNEGGALMKALSGPMNTLWLAIQSNTGVNVSTQTYGQSIFNVMQFGTILMTVSGAFYTIGALIGDTPFTYIVGIICVMIGSALFPVAVTLSIFVPLLPAARFIFGIFTWMLTLFEAVIAMPVVALISINFEGEGMFAHGKQGWFLLLQMMLRPVLMIFGLIGAVMIFDSLAGFITTSVFEVFFGLNSTHTAPTVTTLVLGPMAGITTILQIIGFLYFYALTLYACANMTFQLINTIPDRILNWTGLPGGITTGGDMEGVMSQASSSTSGMITSTASALNQIRQRPADPDDPAAITGGGGPTPPPPMPPPPLPAQPNNGMQFPMLALGSGGDSSSGPPSGPISPSPSSQPQLGDGTGNPEVNGDHLSMDNQNFTRNGITSDGKGEIFSPSKGNKGNESQFPSQENPV